MTHATKVLTAVSLALATIPAARALSDDVCLSCHAAKDALAAIDATLIHAIGDPEASGAIEGEQHLIYATRKNITSRRLDLDALRAEEPETAEKYTRPSISRRLHVPARPKKG